MNDPADTSPPPRTTGGGWRWEPPSPAELQQLLPQFEVERLIGRGGMGAVYRGIQSSLERPVAIKLLPPAIEQQDSAFAERFKNEAKLMGRMNHPAIVSVYDFGHTSDGQLYFVMEYVDGTDVQRMIAREGRLPAEHALAVAAHLCDALAYAHKNGIVHRDIKPSNVLIDLEGRVKVADFGLAKLTTNNANSGLTQTGMAMGTPDYLAPETLTLGSDVDGRADLYAVGVMLYQMLTGDIPRGMFRMPSQKFRNIDPRFDAIVRRALEHDREERYQTSIEIRRDLDVILTTPYAEPGRESSAAIPKQAPQPQGRTVVPSARNHAQASQRQARRFEAAPVPKPAASAASSSIPYLIAALVFLGVGAWFIIPKHESAPETAPPDTTAAPNPFEAPTGTSVPSSMTTARPSPITRPATSSPAGTPASSTPAIATKTPAAGPATPPAAGTAMVSPPQQTPPVKLPPLPPPSTTGSIAERLSTLESQFQNAFEREVNAAYAAQIAALGAGYVTALEQAVSQATRAGKLDEALALRDEKTRFTTHKFMPSIDPAGLHRNVVQLRNTYRATEQSYSQRKDANSLPLYDRYIEVLNSLAQELRAQGRSGDADRVRIKRDDVAARRKQRAAKVSSVAVPPQHTAPALVSLFGRRTLSDWRVEGNVDSFKDITVTML